MRADEIRHLYDYNYWANARIIAAASPLPQGALARPAGLPHGGIFGTLVHVLSAEYVWHSRIALGKSPAAMLSPGQFPDLKALVARWAEQERALRTYLAGIQEAELDSSFSYRSTDGREYTTPLWQTLLHLANHSTQHRAEAAAELTRLGRSPGDIDYMVYIRTEEPRADFTRLRVGPSF
jgi:uncharacterized damage-inducible protein DinB